MYLCAEGMITTLLDSRADRIGRRQRCDDHGITAGATGGAADGKSKLPTDALAPNST